MVRAENNNTLEKRPSGKSYAVAIFLLLGNLAFLFLVARFFFIRLWAALQGTAWSFAHRADWVEAGTATGYLVACAGVAVFVLDLVAAMFRPMRRDSRWPARLGVALLCVGCMVIAVGLGAKLLGH